MITDLTHAEPSSWSPTAPLGKTTPLILLPLLLLAGLGQNRAADWPTCRADYSRSGITTDTLQLPLTELWTYQSVHPPQPAWGGEAKWDGWNKVYDLKPRQIFDYAFEVSVVRDQLFFGSSADDKVYCLDANTGAERWTFFTEGPVRLAPTVYQNQVYVGSDDGFVYCLNAGDGRLTWKTRLAPREYRIPGNGRIISAWPVRTSVIAAEGVAYAGAGMFPSEGVYLYALNLTNGAVIWKQPITDRPAQGYLLASASRLYLPTARDNPLVFNRHDGQRLQTMEGAGGTYALLAGDTLVFGPGKTGQLALVEKDRTDHLATFSGNHLIVTPTAYYLHSDTDISTLNRERYLNLARTRRELTVRQRQIKEQLKALPKPNDSADAAQLQQQLATVEKDLSATSSAMTQCVPWRQPCAYPLSFILAGETLFAGGDDAVAAFQSASGQLAWRSAVHGKAYGLAAAGGRLYVSTDQGAIHCFTHLPK